MEETEETAQVKSSLMKVLSRLMLKGVFCTLCVPNRQIIFRGTDKKERSQSGYIAREERKHMFEVNGASFIRKSSPTLNRDRGLKIPPVCGARKWSRGLRSCHRQLNQVSVFACLHKRPVHRLNKT